MNELHIGTLIRDELRRQGLNNRILADALSINMRTVNKIFRKQDIDTSQLLRISQCLGVDFFKYYFEKVKELVRPYK